MVSGDAYEAGLSVDADDSMVPVEGERFMASLAVDDASVSIDGYDVVLSVNTTLVESVNKINR